MLTFEHWKDPHDTDWWGVPIEDGLYQFGYGSLAQAQWAIEKDIAIKINPIGRGWTKLCT